MCDSRCSCRLYCGLRHALRRSLFVVACCLGNGRLHQQWACISVGTGCLGNGWLHQQWACISVGAGCLGNGGRPSPTERLRPTARDSLKSRFCSSHWVSQSLHSPGLAYCPSLIQSQVQPSQVSGCRFNRAPGQARPVGSAGGGPAAATPAAGFARQRYCLASHVSFILGNFPVPWATKISLEMQFRLTSPWIQ